MWDPKNIHSFVQQDQEPAQGRRVIVTQNFDTVGPVLERIQRTSSGRSFSDSYQDMPDRGYFGGSGR
jgi:hypothetical protein